MLLKLNNVDYSVLRSIKLMVSSAYEYGDQPCSAMLLKLEQTIPRASACFILVCNETRATHTDSRGS